jgi:TetR/AcrR family transcriptional regulator, transcriptional repressor for nem operon
MPPTTDTRQRLIDAAAELFWERGYAATGLSDILESAGARGGSLYHFFPTKDDLLLAVLDHHARVLETTIENTLAAHEEPRDKVLAFVEFYRRFMERTGFSLGCPLTNLAAEISDTHAPAVARIASFNDRIVQRLAECLAACDEPTIRSGAAPIATSIVSLVQGATLQARAGKSAEPLIACAVAVRRLIGADPVVSVVAARSAAFAES